MHIYSLLRAPSPSHGNGLLPILILNSSQSMESISFLNSIYEFFSTFSCFCSHPLFSTFVTIYTLILIYAPSFFLKVVLSPVLNSTGIILLWLLKLGAKERLGKGLSSQEIRILGSSANERLEKESDYLEPKAIGHKDKHFELPSNNANNLTLYSCYGLESTSLEQRLVELLDSNQTNIKFEAKVELGFGSSKTSTESKSDSSLYLESNEVHVEFEHDSGHESNSQDDCYKGELLDTNFMQSQMVEKRETRMEIDSIKVDATMKFLEWNMKAPLEIIYEAYEGEEEYDDSNENSMDSSNKGVMLCERYPSLSMYYPESETDSSSDDDFPISEKWRTHKSVFFKWETEEDERDELIEISLDHCVKRSIEFCQDEEDSLIEIDIFPQETEY